ncbi:MAG: hypothetical protein AB7I18_09185 [Candidatus Berkiella sp.]
MKFTRLDITNKTLARSDFVNQPRKLFVLPDNLPDFRLPRNRLHDTKNRGGLAQAMRPNKIGGTDIHPIYDVNVVGIPTLSFDAKEGLSVKHIAEGFANIYRLVKSDEFDEIVVPYKNGKPAFGGGVAGAIPSIISNAIEEEFNRLEKFLTKKVVPNDFPQDFAKAYVEGPLPIALTYKEKINRYLNDRFPRLVLFTHAAVAFGASLGTYWGFAASLSALPLVGAMLVASTLAVALYRFVLKGFFGRTYMKVQLSQSGNALPKSLDIRGGVISMFGLQAGYKSTLPEVEAELKSTLSKFFKKPKDQTDSNYQEQLSNLIKFNAKNLILSDGERYFYEADIARVKSKEYDVDAQVAEYRRKKIT